MKERLFKLLGIETGEESMVSMLLAQSVFLGIFFGAFDISAHSLFLSIFDEKMMARGYVVSGLAGIILTSLYTSLQTRMVFKSFAISNLIFVTFVTILLWLLLLLIPAKGVIFLVFIMLGPLNILAMLGFWGTTGRLFTLRQGKRLFGLVDAGVVIGIIISCYSIPVLLALNFSPHNIMLISAGSVLTASIMQIIIGSRFRLSSGKTDETGKKSEKKSLFSLFRNDTYIRIIAIFIAISVMTAFFVQYSFMAVTREQYPAEEDMARFLGLFTGSMMIFTLLIKLLVFSYLIRNYGLRTCLALSPILIAAFTLIAVLIGTFMGFTPAAGGFMLFFMLLALSRLFSKALKDSIESPSFKVIYQTLDEKYRFEIQSGMDGTINEIAALTSGLLLAGLGILSFVRLIHFSWVLFALTLIWILIAIRLYTEYRKSIRNALEPGSMEKPEVEFHSIDTLPENPLAADLAFQGDYFNLISGNLSVMENKDSHYFNMIIDYSASNSDINLVPALKRIADDKQIDGSIRKHSSETAENLEMIAASDNEKDEKLLSAKKILSENRQPQTTLILRLLRDHSLESKKLAINMIGKFKFKEMIPDVCECLNVPGLEIYAEGVLKSFGAESSEELQRFYLVSSGNAGTGKSVLRILGSAGIKENEAFLFSRLWSNSRQLKEVAMKCLINAEYKAPDEERDRLHQYISDIIGIITWNIAARITIARSNDSQLLDAMNREIGRWNAFLFNLLSVTYDSGSIKRIRENLESGTVESVNYALEMVDIVIDDSIKPKLVPLLDIIPDEEKVKSLYQFFPGEIPDNKKLIEDIINRDYNLLGIWIRACAIRNNQTVLNPDLAESLSALLFSPEVILREESAKMIARTGMETFKSVSDRLPDDIKMRLRNIIDGETTTEELLYEKVRFLSKVIPELSDEDLLPLAGALQYKGGADPIPATAGGKYITLKTETGSGIYNLSLNSIKEFIYRFPEHAAEIIKNIDIN